MSEPTRLTVNLVPKAVDALDHATARERESATDVVNRALQAYDFMTEKMGAGWIVVLRDPVTGAEEQVRFL